MDAMSQRILDLCMVEAKAEKRRAKAAREVREARRKRLALAEMSADKSLLCSGRRPDMEELLAMPEAAFLKVYLEAAHEYTEAARTMQWCKPILLAWDKRKKVRT